MSKLAFCFRNLLLAVAWVLLVCAVPASADDTPSVPAARKLLHDGYYQTAIDMLAKLRAANSADPAAAATLLDCYHIVGRYDDAIKLADADAPKSFATSAEWYETKARAYLAVGRYDDALAALTTALELSPDRHSARLALGRLYETLGRRDDAIAAYEPFDDIMHNELPAGADDLTNLGEGFYRYSALTRHPNLRNRTTHVLQEVFQHAVQRVDPDCWPALLASGNLLASKYNDDSASEDYEAARKINHNLPQVYVGLGRLALEHWDFDQVEHHVDTALEINPNYAPALHLLADLRLTERRWQDAADTCEKALAINDKDANAIARLAAARWRLGDEAAADELLARIKTFNPIGGPFFEVMGIRLAEARQFPESEQFFLKGVEAAPENANLRTEFGLMYMQWGDETKARQRCAEAWGLDPFNRRTYNTLELLDDLDRFERHETEHFTIRHAGEIDRAVAPYLADYMESIYEEVCGDFEHDLKDKTIIEVFPAHRQFAVRITHQPFIHTIGACTGRVIAMDAPRPTTGFGATFNWAQVLRHEFTHTVTLAATRNRIAHWLTEGLAVYEEDTPRSWRWCQLLSRRLRQNRLYTFDRLDWGFIRPQHPEDRTAAYAQSAWICEYLVETYGYDVILSLMEKLRDGVPIDDALKQVSGKSQKELFKAFRAWAKQQVKRWNLSTEPVPASLTFQAQLLINKDDANLRARYAEALLFEGEYEEAYKEVVAALARDENETKALELFCMIADGRASREREKDDKLEILDDAAKYAQQLLKTEPYNYDALMVLAERAALREDNAAAEKYFKALQLHYPIALRSYHWLGARALEQGDEARALANLTELWRLEREDVKVAKQVARIHQRREQDDQALYWWHEAVCVDPYDTEIHEQLGAMYLKRRDLEHALREYRILADLEPEEAKRWADLALVYHRMGDAEQTKAAAQKAVDLDPDSTAKSLLD